MRVSAAVVLAAASLSGCGYHVGGHANLLPKTIKTIAVPAFANVTPSFRLPDRRAQLGSNCTRRCRSKNTSPPKC